MTDLVYELGTVSVSSGSTTVAGDGVIWSGVNAREWDDISIDDGPIVPIASVTDDTHLELAQPAAATKSNVTYKIFQRSPLRFVGGQAMADVSFLIAILNSKGLLWYLPAGYTQPSDVQPPLTADDGQGILKIDTGALWVMQSGSWVSAGTYKGFEFKGAYNSDAAYNINDVITSAGSAYIVTASTTGNAPPNASYYSLLASKGDTGNTGATGADATIAVGTVTGVAYGQPATVTNSGTAGAAVFDFEIPKGQDGTGNGDVQGPSSATDAAVVGFDGTTGKQVKELTAAEVQDAAGATTVGKALLTAADAAAVRSAAGAAVNDLSNVSLAVSAAAGALTIGLKDASGNDPTTDTPIILNFRNSSNSGALDSVVITSAVSLTLSSGSTLGVPSSKAFRLWVVGFNDAGTFRLGAILCTEASSGRAALYEDHPASSTAEGGAGGADSALVIYTGTAVTNKAMRVLGYIEWSSSGVTAGTWTTTNINYVQTFGPGIKLPGEVVQRRWVYTSTATSNATSTFTDTNLQKAITPISAANAIKIHAEGALLCPAASTRGAVQIRRGSGASGPQIGVVMEAYGNGGTAIMPLTINWLDFPQSTSSVTYTAQVASQNNTGTVQFPQAPTSSSNVYGFMELEEIQT